MVPVLSKTKMFTKCPSSLDKHSEAGTDIGANHHGSRFASPNSQEQATTRAETAVIKVKCKERRDLH